MQTRNTVKDLAHELSFGRVRIFKLLHGEVPRQEIQNTLRGLRKSDKELKHVTKVQTQNEDVPLSSIDAAIDHSLYPHVLRVEDKNTYGFAGAISRSGHGRAVALSEGKPFLVAGLRCLKCGQTTYELFTNETSRTKKGKWVFAECSSTTLALWSKVNREHPNCNIKTILMDRVSKEIAQALEEIGITVVVYGKRHTFKELVSTRNPDGKRPYNTLAESQFGNIAKTFYRWTNEHEDLIEEFETNREFATVLVRAFLEAYLKNNVKPSLEYLEYLAQAKEPIELKETA